MGKWSHLKKQFDKLIKGEEGYRDKISHWKEVTLGDSQDRNEWMEALAQLEDRKYQLEAEVSELNPRIEALQELIITDMEERGETSVKTSKFGTFFVKDEPYSSIEDSAVFVEWLKANNMEDILKPNWQTTNAMVKGYLEAGDPTPPGIRVFIKTSLGRRRG